MDRVRDLQDGSLKMNRFDMLAGRRKDKPVAYRFKATSSPVRIYGYIQKCMEDDVSLDTSNLYPTAVDGALKKLYEDKKIPTVTGSEKMMRVLGMGNLKKVYSINDIPEGIILVVCYWDLDPKRIPKNIEIALTLLRTENG